MCPWCLCKPRVICRIQIIKLCPSLICDIIWFGTAKCNSKFGFIGELTTIHKFLMIWLHKIWSIRLRSGHGWRMTLRCEVMISIILCVWLIWSCGVWIVSCVILPQMSRYISFLDMKQLCVCYFTVYLHHCNVVWRRCHWLCNYDIIHKTGVVNGEKAIKDKRHLSVPEDSKIFVEGINFSKSLLQQEFKIAWKAVVTARLLLGNINTASRTKTDIFTNIWL